MNHKAPYYVYVLKIGSTHRPKWRREHLTFDAAFAEANRLHTLVGEGYRTSILGTVIEIGYNSSTCATVTAEPVAPVVTVKKRKVIDTSPAK